MAYLNSAKAAELIRAQTGRPCTRQRLEKQFRNGSLPRSTLQTCPARVDSKTVVAEFSADTCPSQMMLCCR
jgi:hypothetical protein